MAQTTNTKIAVIAKDIEYIKEGIRRIEEAQEMYATKAALQATNEEVNALKKGVVFVVGTVIVAVIGAILRLVIPNQ